PPGASDTVCPAPRSRGFFSPKAQRSRPAAHRGRGSRDQGEISPGRLIPGGQDRGGSERRSRRGAERNHRVGGPAGTAPEGFGIYGPGVAGHPPESGIGAAGQFRRPGSRTSGEGGRPAFPRGDVSREEDSDPPEPVPRTEDHRTWRGDRTLR